MKAAERFRPDEGASFSTYAAWWIKQSIRRAISTTVKNVRVPAYMADMVSRWRRVSNELTQGLERSASPDEIAEAMRIDPQKIAIIQQAIGADTSSSVGRRAWASRNTEDQTDLIEELPARQAESGPASELFSGENQRKMEILLECLEEREARVLRLRYGLDGGGYHTLQAIGEDLELTRERVRQIETAALTKILRILGEDV
jgi:RNA polymerase primary sigma factor